MFEVDVNEFSTSTNKLLSNIENLLKEQNQLLRQVLSIGGTNSVEPVKNDLRPNIDNMGRPELLAIVKTFPKGVIQGKYMTLSTEDLRKRIKEAV